MLLLIRHEKLDNQRLAAAIRATFAKRATHPVPRKLGPPPSEWEPVFQALARDLKKEYPEAEKDFTGWYEANIKVWPSEIRAALLAELSESIENTPVGKERTAVGTENSGKAKLQAFLENLTHKHRPR